MDKYRMDAYGEKAPQKIGDTAYGVAVLTAIVGVIIGVVIGKGTSTAPDVPAVSDWPTGAAVILGALLLAFGWVAVGAFFHWLVAVYGTIAGGDGDR